MKLFYDLFVIHDYATSYIINEQSVNLFLTAVTNNDRIF